MNDDRNREPDLERDRALAYLRNELTLVERTRFIEQAADDPALREELGTLQAAAQIAAEEYADATADASFARLAATLGLRAQESTRDEQGNRSSSGVTASRAIAHVSWHERLRAWWRAHGNVLQPALIALVIAQSGVIAHFVGASGTSDSAAGAKLGADTVVTRGPAVSCDDVWVTFKDGVTEQQLREWLTLFGASIAAGPDDAGRYRIVSRDADARAALLQSPESRRLASRVELPPGCRRN